MLCVQYVPSAGVAQYSNICACCGTIEYAYSVHLRSLHCRPCRVVCVVIAGSYCVRLVSLIHVDKGYIEQARVYILSTNRYL